MARSRSLKAGTISLAYWRSRKGCDYFRGHTRKFLFITCICLAIMRGRGLTKGRPGFFVQLKEVRSRPAVRFLYKPRPGTVRRPPCEVHGGSAMRFPYT